jgi:arginine:pyruvate transaminase
MTYRLNAPEDDVWRVHYDAVAKFNAGEDVLLMSVGDPDFATPEDIIETLVARIRAGRTHYSPAAGEPALRQAIADLESAGTGRSFGPEQFVILPGATAGIYATLACICNPGDEVIIPEPMYIGYRAIVNALGLRTRSVDLDLERDCALDVEQVLGQVTASTKAVVVNTPGNPCGNCIEPEALRALAEGLRQRNVWLICDEVYSLFTFEEPHVSLLKCADHMDNAVVVDGLSKSHAMTGWRIGWVAAPPQLAAAISAYAGAAFFGCSQFIQDAAAYALRHNAPHVDRMREAYRQRRDFVAQRLDRVQQLGYIQPHAGMFMMVDVRQVSRDGETFARGLLDAEGVSLIPGRGFGRNAAGYVRLSLTQTIEVVEDALQRIERYTNGL